MGKRSDFERILRDRYLTPLKAVFPLVPYLQRDGVRTFADLCDGGGAVGLVHHLEGAGFRCVQRGDIITGQDALKVKRYVGNPDVGITNPPYKYPEDHDRSTRLLRDLIRHFLDLGVPFWLLLPHDWSVNKGSAHSLRYCTDVVAVGRIKWIKNSKYTSKDNFCWYRFDVRYRGDTALRNNRDARSAPIKQAPPNGRGRGMTDKLAPLLPKITQLLLVALDRGSTDGERANALRAVRRQLEGAGADSHDLIERIENSYSESQMREICEKLESRIYSEADAYVRQQIERFTNDDPPVSAPAVNGVGSGVSGYSWLEIAQHCERNAHRLSPWEREFATSVARWVRYKPPTLNQAAKLHDIFAKKFGERI